MKRYGSARELALARLDRAWEEVRSSYWFIPSVMAVLAAGVAVAMLTLDRRVPAERLTDIPWIYSGDADGARDVLSTVGGSMITVAGVVFSITIVVLSLASSQYGPRLVRNFLRDTGNEVVLGSFIATFIYCLIVLRAIRGDAENAGFVPQMSVTVGVGTGLLSLAVLIYYIQHVAASIRVEHVIHMASRDVDSTLDEVFPVRVGLDAAATTAAGGDFERLAAEALPYTVTTDHAGYIEHLDGPGLVSFAAEHDLVIELIRRPGDFVVVGEPVARMWRAGDRGRVLADGLRDRIFIGRQRTPLHDLIAAAERLTEIAARALSTGVNDPFTAVNCIDELSAGLARLAALELPQAYRYDAEGCLRLIAVPISFAEVLVAAYAPLRLYGGEQPIVLTALLQGLARVGRCTADVAVRTALREEADAIAEQVEAGRLIESDRRRLQALHRVTAAALA
jgi:uncharacterized membrane protein